MARRWRQRLLPPDSIANDLTGHKRLRYAPWFDPVRLSYENLRNQHQLDWLYDGCVLVDTYRAGDDTPVWVREQPALLQESRHGP